jgi:hypothetical protein
MKSEALQVFVIAWIAPGLAGPASLALTPLMLINSDIITKKAMREYLRFIMFSSR